MQRNSIVNSARQEGFVHAATVSAAGFGLASARTRAASVAWGLGAEAQALLDKMQKDWWGAKPSRSRAL